MEQVEEGDSNSKSKLICVGGNRTTITEVSSVVKNTLQTKKPFQREIMLLYVI